MSQTPIRTVGRMVDLIELFDHTTPTRDIRDLVEASGLPKSTVVRLASDLVSRGVLSVDSRGRYSIGATFLRWTLLAERMWRVDEATQEVLQDLVRDLGETATLYVRQDLERTPIASADGRHAVRNVVEIGARMPLTVGASAMVLLSGDLSIIDRLEQRDPTLDADRLRERARQVVENGYAFSEGEREIGAASIATPIRNHNGRVIAALSISGPVSRFTEQARQRALTRLRSAGDLLSNNGIGPVGGLT
ncbi:IclR family transcriptional regulator [Arthrobacter sulfonylureivorans]|uniref:IclR family transcriptional regulator n=1 Tax=Arthrobacter sulfonylureivorans TaxID=2486855 RepID=A0ABY3W5Y3_9MICC|nr:IclR family transcriptional regulator [Arthrobacter sulfonylureivorans]UNK45687.1 IclR family transcriptional regulator [Arthrobacter sulfonylureivorans]